MRDQDGTLMSQTTTARKVEDEASQAESKSGRPMFGDRFPA